MKAALILGLLFSFAEKTPLPTPPHDGVVQAAAAYVAKLHDSMLDPSSFVVDNVFVSQPNKLYESHGMFRGKLAGSYVNICVSVRSHNTMGGYSAQEYKLVASKGEPALYVLDDPNTQLGIQSFPNTVCNRPTDIKDDVVPIAESLYKKAK